MSFSVVVSLYLHEFLCSCESVAFMSLYLYESIFLTSCESVSLSLVVSLYLS